MATSRPARPNIIPKTTSTPSTVRPPCPPPRTPPPVTPFPPIYAPCMLHACSMHAPTMHHRCSANHSRSLVKQQMEFLCEVFSAIQHPFSKFTPYHTHHIAHFSVVRVTNDPFMLISNITPKPSQLFAPTTPSNTPHDNTQKKRPEYSRDAPEVGGGFEPPWTVLQTVD